MIKEVYFKDFEGLLHHYQYIENQLNKTIGKFEHLRPIHLRINIDSMTHKRLFRDHQFGCEIIAHHPEIKNTMMVHKFSKNFYQSVNQACKALETMIRRNFKSKQSTDRRVFDMSPRQETIAEAFYP